MIKHFFAVWKLVAVIALFFVLATFLAEFLLPLDEGQRHLLEALDLAAIAVFAVDLAIHYTESKAKKGFFRRNWFLVVSLFPLASFLRALKAVRVLGTIIAAYLSKGFHILTHSSKFMRAYRIVAVWSGSKKKPSKKGKKRLKNQR